MPGIAGFERVRAGTFWLLAGQPDRSAREARALRHASNGNVNGASGRRTLNVFSYQGQGAGQRRAPTDPAYGGSGWDVHGPLGR